MTPREQNDFVADPRKLAKELRRMAADYVIRLPANAADAIDAALDERDAHKERADEALKAYEIGKAQWTRALSTISRLQAENERWKEAHNFLREEITILERRIAQLRLFIDPDSDSSPLNAREMLRIDLERSKENHGKQ